MVMEWSNSRELLAVAGTLRTGLDGTKPEELGLTSTYTNLVKFYTETPS